MVLNAAWVAGSLALIATGAFTTLGSLAVAAVAAAVLVSAGLEMIGLRKLG